LKSPIQMVCSGPVACLCLSQSCKNADICVSALLFFPLMIHNVPNWPIISTAIMSGWSKSICFHASVRRLVLMRVTDLVLSGCVLCVLGYIVVQLRFACVLPWKSMYGSCIMHMSYTFCFRLCSRSSWLSRDLLAFCCHICSGRWVCSCLWSSGIVKRCWFSVIHDLISPRDTPLWWGLSFHSA